jgi:peroxiredoxin
MNLFLSGWVLAAGVGTDAPNCKLADFSNGESIEFRQYRGNVIYVDFWASWCPPCAKSFNFLNGVHQELQPEGLKILGVNLDEKPDDARSFLEQFPAEFDVVADNNAACAKLFDVKAMPSSYLIDRNGVIRHVHLGFRSSEAKNIKIMIHELLAEKHSEQLSYYPNP